MSTPENLEILSQLIGPHVAKRDTAAWFANMFTAIQAGLIVVQDLRINIHVTKGVDELRVEFDAMCCDGPLRTSRLEGIYKEPHVQTGEQSVKSDAAACGLTKGCWLENGHDGHCD